MKPIILGALTLCLASVLAAGEIHGKVTCKGVRDSADAVVYVAAIPGKTFAAPQAHAKIDQLTAEGKFKPKRIVTKVAPAQTFWRAEDYHQRYLEKRGQASCHI